MSDTFRWTGPLGISVILFSAIGLLWIVIGVLAVPLHKRGNPDYLFVSQPVDTAFFGAPSSQLAPFDSPLAKFRTLLITVLSGGLVAAGALFISVALFGLKQGHAWALAALAIAGLAAVVFWWIALLPYFRAGIPVGVGDLPPFIWVPSALIPPATILGWLGIR
jgi:hypothetical protein